MSIIVELSDVEIELVKRGLSDHISDYCFNDNEEKQYKELFDKIAELKDKKEIPISNIKCITTEIETVYSPEGDMTFILEEKYDEDGEPLSTECVGWYYGTPNEEDTTTFNGKLKAEYLMGRETQNEEVTK